MTEAEIHSMKTKADGWHHSNPFKARLMARLGGLHRTPPTDRQSLTVEARIEIARETAEALAEPATEF